MTSSLKVVFLVSLSFFFSTFPAAANQTEPEPNEKESISSSVNNEFIDQKKFMVEDTGEKIRVLQTTHNCAKAATNSAELTECNNQLRKAILGKSKDKE